MKFAFYFTYHPLLILINKDYEKGNIFPRSPSIVQTLQQKASFTAYLERIRAANHEIVDKLLQAEDDEDESTDNHQRGNDTCRLPEKRLAHLFYLRTILVLLLQALPQTVEEVEEAAWNPEITDYIFRPEREYRGGDR